MPTIVDGDRNFTGVNERQDAGQLQPGVLSRGINIDITRGEINSRKGIKAVRALASLCINFPTGGACFPLKFDTLEGHGQIYGAEKFTSQFGYFYFLLVLERFALRVHESGAIEVINYPVDLTITDDVEIRQAFNEVFLFRGEPFSTMVWNGSTKGQPAFREVVTTGLAAGVEPMPKTSIAIYYKNRIWATKNRDEIVFSDIGSSTKFSLQNQFKIDSGSFDNIVNIHAWGDHAILVFKERSVDVLENLVGDLTVNATRTILSSEIGLASPSCTVDTGSDLWFLNESGWYSIRQALDNKLQSDSEPLSSPMQPVFDRINWSVKSQFRAVYFDNKVILAAALDDSILNNALIVYSFITKSWHGYMQADFMDAERLFTNIVGGEARLFYVTNAGQIHQVFTGYDDDPLTGVQPFTSTAITRGYGAADLERKQFRSLTVDISTCDPSFTLSVRTDGVNENQDLLPAPTTKDNTKYYTTGTPRYVTSNINDDFNDPYREDYCICFDSTCEPFPFCFPLCFEGAKTQKGTYELCLGDNGVCPDLLQRSQDKRALNAKGDYMVTKIVNTTGRMRVHSFKITAFTTNEVATITV